MRVLQQKLLNSRNGNVIANRIMMADNFWLRLHGLVGRPVLQTGEAMWITRCQQVHTQFMKVPLDLIFIDKHMVVKRVVTGIKPWRFSPWVKEAHAVIEMTAADRLSVQEGDLLVLEETSA